MSAGWDAAVILLGNNYGEKPNVFLAELDKMLVALPPRPVLLLTVTEFESIQTEVNDDHPLGRGGVPERDASSTGRR